MKRKIYLSVTLLALALSAICQFVSKPMNFPGTGYYYPYAISIVDHTHCWFGTQWISSSGDILPYPFAIHTNNGGETFVYDSIPIGGTPYILDLSAVDSSLCYYARQIRLLIFLSGKQPMEVPAGKRRRQRNSKAVTWTFIMLSALIPVWPWEIPLPVTSKSRSRMMEGIHG